MCELLGYSRPELLAKTIDEISLDKDEAATLFKTYLQDGLQQGDFIVRHKNGTPIFIKYRSWVFADGCLAATWQLAEEWEQRYVAALLEFRLDQLQHKVALAVEAIRARQAALTSRDNLEIHKKLRDAISNLHKL